MPNTANICRVTYQPLALCENVRYRQANWLVRQFGKLTNEISVRDYDDYYKRKFTTHKRTSVSRLVIKITQYFNYILKMSNVTALHK